VDLELEIGTLVGPGNQLGSPLSVSDAWESIFGYVILNDVSLRDVQNWEYVPLGPFTSKNFISVVSPWVVTPDALAPLRVNLPE
jgi:fumarylacetoacetase